MTLHALIGLLLEGLRDYDLAFCVQEQRGLRPGL